VSNLTLEDIAKQVGVSRSTVSRVVNDDPNVREIILKRVPEVIQITSYYHPNAAARSLVRCHSQILRVVIPQGKTFIFEDAFFPALLQGISDAASRLALLSTGIRAHILTLE
jgi:LacI family transcriptional regulator